MFARTNKKQLWKHFLDFVDCLIDPKAENLTQRKCHSQWHFGQCNPNNHAIQCTARPQVAHWTRSLISVQRHTRTQTSGDSRNKCFNGNHMSSFPSQIAMVMSIMLAKSAEQASCQWWKLPTTKWCSIYSRLVPKGLKRKGQTSQHNKVCFAFPDFCNSLLDSNSWAFRQDLLIFKSTLTKSKYAFMLTPPLILICGLQANNIQ